MNQASLSELANITGITKSKIKYWASLLNLKITKENRILFLAQGSEVILTAMAKSISCGLSPAIAAKEVLSVHALPVVRKNKEVNTNKLTDRIASLENAVMLLVEQNKSLATTVENQNKVIIANLRSQGNQLNKLQLKLDPPQQTTKIEAWKPTEPKRPQFSTIQRLWYEITAPEKLRAN